MGNEQYDKAAATDLRDELATEKIVLGKLCFEFENGEMFVNRLAGGDPEGDADHVGTCEIDADTWTSFTAACKTLATA